MNGGSRCLTPGELGGASRVARITLVDSFPAGPSAYSLARAGDAKWVTSFAGADVRRYEP